ncbi:MAG: T9SS type A sorting domain-containing protein [Ignavibacteria bacterium]|nr:T9SS type A sorting domain-containing protein [Ignavibacteria bacterium]
MKKYLLFLTLLFSSLIFPQTVTINEPQTKYTVRHYYGVSPEFSYYQFNSDHDLGHYNVAYGKWMDWVSCYKISLAGVPPGYPIKSITLTANITQQEYTPNNFVVNISKLPNNTDLSTGSSNAEPLYNAISTAGSSIGSFKYSDTFSQDIKSSITSGDFSDNYIIIGVKDASSLDNSRAKISISLAVTYYLPLALTVDNNFVDNSGNGTHGQVSVDGTTQTVPSSGVSLTRNIGQNLTLSAISLQQDNQGYQRTWHTGTISSSDWTRNGVSKSPYQTYSFSVAEDDGGKTYMANLRKICNVTFQNSFTGNGNGGTITVNGQNCSSPTSQFQVVELNPITAYAQSQTINNINYTFSQWNDGNTSNPRTFFPSSHYNYSANFIGKPTNSGEYVNFGSSVGQPIVIYWIDNSNTNVTQYQIWRRVKHNGVVGPNTHIGTVNRGVQSFTDYSYLLTASYSADLIWYDVRAYYSIEGTYSDPQWSAVFGEYDLAPKIKDDNSNNIITVASELPTKYSISNYPNPFNPSTTIKYQLPESGHVTIKVYDILGKEVATLVNENKQAGYHKIDFDGSKLTSGIYIYTIKANNFAQSKKMIIAK